MFLQYFNYKNSCFIPKVRTHIPLIISKSALMYIGKYVVSEKISIKESIALTVESHYMFFKNLIWYNCDTLVKIVDWKLFKWYQLCWWTVYGQPYRISYILAHSAYFKLFSIQCIQYILFQKIIAIYYFHWYSDFYNYSVLHLAYTAQL